MLEFTPTKVALLLLVCSSLAYGLPLLGQYTDAAETVYVPPEHRPKPPGQAPAPPPAGVPVVPGVVPGLPGAPPLGPGVFRPPLVPGGGAFPGVFGAVPSPPTLPRPPPGGFIPFGAGRTPFPGGPIQVR